MIPQADRTSNGITDKMLRPLVSAFKAAVRWFRSILSWLIVRDLVSPLVTLVATFVGWSIATTFQKQQLDLDTKAKLAAQIEKLAEPQKQRIAIPGLADFGETHPDLVVRYIAITLDQGDPEIKQACYAALERITDRNHVVALIEAELVGNPSHSVGLPEALVLLSPDKAFQALKKSFEKDKRRESKIACATALAVTRNEEAFPLLTQCLHDEEGGFRELRVACLKSVGVLAAAGLPGQGAKAAVGELAKYVYDPDLGPDALAAIANVKNLGTILNQDERRTVAGALVSSLRRSYLNEESMARFVESVGEIGTENDVPALLDLLPQKELSERVRKRVLDSVFKLGKACVIGQVKRTLKRPELTWRIQMRVEWWEKELSHSPCREK